MRFNDDGTQLFTASVNKRARVYDVKTGKTLRYFIGHTSRVTCLAVRGVVTSNVKQNNHCVFGCKATMMCGIVLHAIEYGTINASMRLRQTFLAMAALTALTSSNGPAVGLSRRTA